MPEDCPKMFDPGVDQLVVNLVPDIGVVEELVRRSYERAHPDVLSKDAVKYHIMMGSPVTSQHVRPRHLAAETYLAIRTYHALPDQASRPDLGPWPDVGRAFDLAEVIDLHAV